jgi:hypothetical protein
MTGKVKALQNLAFSARIAAATLGVLGLGAASAAAELFVEDGYTETLGVKALKSLVTISTFLLLLSLAVKHYAAFVVVQSARSHHSTEYTLQRRDRILRFFCEVVVCCIHTPPGISGQWWSAVETSPVRQSLDGTISVIMTARIYLILPLLRDLMKFNTATATMIARYNDVKFDTAFALRALLALYPLRAIAALIVLVTLVITYALRTFERGACEDAPQAAPWCNSSGSQDFSQLKNALWATIITSLTVGYGDIYPRTVPGRLVAVLAAFSGIILIALLVSTVTRHVELQLKHHNALDVLKQHNLRLQYKEAAGKLVLQCLRLNKCKSRRAMLIQASNRSLQNEISPYAASGFATTSQPAHQGNDYAFALALRKWRQLKNHSDINSTDDSMSLLLHEMKLTNNSVTKLAAEVAVMRARQTSLDHKIERLLTACLAATSQSTTASCSTITTGTTTASVAVGATESASGLAPT